MKINMNIKLRLKDPLFIIQLLAMVIGIIAQAIAVDIAEITTWGKLWEVIKAIFANPYVLWTILINLVINLVNLFRDPTTSGLSDSARAMEYETPNDSDVLYGTEIAKEIEDPYEVR